MKRPDASSTSPARVSAPASNRGIFRFESQLPKVDSQVTLGEGSTPLVELPRLAEAIPVGRLYAKLEGSNPTGSYKDRIAAMTMSLAMQKGNPGWIATSSGNAGASLAAYGARAGLPGYLFVTPNIPREKLLPAVALGVTVFKVDGVGDNGDAEADRLLFHAVQEAATDNGLFLGVTAHRYNPEGMRGAETIGFELGSEVPMNVYVPTGGGGLASAIGRGLMRVGSESVVVVAQPEGCAPIVRCLDGELETPVVDMCRSHISALQLPSPPDGELAVNIVRSTNGWGTACSDTEIMAAQRLLASTEGLFVEPSSAAALAAVLKDRTLGRLDSDADVLLVLTATGLKDLVAVEDPLESPPVLSLDQIPLALSAAMQEAR